jgi:N-acyl amino acid synthase of PEP-CTERM/exosortase system
MFDQYFEVFLADNAAGQDVNYQLRYRVYCVETGYEDPKNFPDLRERDEFDSRSVHFVVASPSTGHWVAAMRLVIDAWDKLPFSQFAKIDQDQLVRLMDARSMADFALSGEISRMCVVSQYRRRPLEKQTPYQIPWNVDEERPQEGPSDERRRAPWLMLALLYAARDYSVRNGVNYWFFLAARALARIFKGLGMGLEQTGPGCEHRGTRYPHTIRIPSEFDKFEIKYPKLAETIPQGIRYKRFSDGNPKYTLPPPNLNDVDRGQRAEF